MTPRLRNTRFEGGVDRSLWRCVGRFAMVAIPCSEQASAASYSTFGQFFIQPAFWKTRGTWSSLGTTASGL